MRLWFVLITCCTASQWLPQVDLGYEIHQAISYDNRSHYYTFSNIRFAQPPVGPLRFAAPVTPTVRNLVVQTGSFSPICPQSEPLWSIVSNAFVAAFAAGNETIFNYTAAVEAANATVASGIPYQPDPQETEDCLFLDVVVPDRIFQNQEDGGRKVHDRNTHGAPVLIWFYGGGYVSGSKTGDDDVYNPRGLINASYVNGGLGFVYVAINYRLGALGWLGGSIFQEQGGTANAALLDQRLGIEWVKKNIHLFGGDPNQITLMGESAGAGSIMHQITAYAGHRPVSFQRAIMQSPAIIPISAGSAENATVDFFGKLNVTSLAEARTASSADVMRANALVVAASPYGQFTFGPTVDGVFVATQARLALLNDKFAKNVQILAGHNTNEGPLITPPYVKTDEDLTAWFQGTYPTVDPALVNYIVTTVYPAIYDSTYPWTNSIDRTIQLISEQIFTCNTDYLARAFGNRTYNYEFAVPPATHGTDILSTFYQGQGSNLSQALYAPVALAMQAYITNFVMTGNPNLPSTGDYPPFPTQGNNATELRLNYTNTADGVVRDIEIVRDSTVNERCLFWQKALYL